MPQVSPPVLNAKIICGRVLTRVHANAVHVAVMPVAHLQTSQCGAFPTCTASAGEYPLKLNRCEPGGSDCCQVGRTVKTHVH